MNRIVKLVSIAMLAVILTVGVAGCFGNFAVGRKVYDFNQNFGGKWENQILFWVMNIVPIYGLAMISDALLFNTIEFWTGSNPIAMGAG
jgi:heme/copper-type cytochrome/quinol oxidase subunit 2